jgi:hypothetical protein
MNQQFRDQVNAARRAGYSDADIIGFLSKQDPRIANALNEGYNPSEVLNFLAPTPTPMETAERGAGVAVRGALPYATTATAGAATGFALGGPPGAIAGTIAALLAQGLSDAAIYAYNSSVSEDQRIPSTTEGLKMLYDRMGFGVKPETRGERMLEAGTEAAIGTIPMVKAGQLGKALPGSLGSVATEVSRAPITQYITAAPLGSGTQYVAEATGSPALATLFGVGAGTAAGMRPKIRGGSPPAEVMEKNIASAYNIMNKSNIVISDVGFQNSFVSGLEKELRASGYSPTNPKTSGIAPLLEDLKNNDIVKDANEIQAIRQRITASADPQVPAEYKLMKIVRDRFDEYLANLPDSDVVAGKKGDLLAWKSARDLFNKQSKANIFTSILENAPVSKGQFSQSGMENYLYNELKKLSRDDKKLRLFSSGEQKAIKDAAAGSGLQNALKFIGRFAPTGPVAAIPTGLVGVATLDPTLTSAIGLGTLASRYGAEQLRIGSIQRIIDQILTGQTQPSPTLNVPATAMRGLLSTQQE